ncbi:zinc finger CCCH domain-containing protein 14-like [Sycon ciliatum]|uniref:zinc finger CCCH domain-containing protein 14-like n=1 Tax=Sycon ciliatum TaxID=27933 RepID=UPI0031F6862C
MAIDKSELRQLVCDKLIAISCYIDDELPDYIVAMVINGKSREHMSKDLSVFTGGQSDDFLDWLMKTVHDMSPGTQVATAPIKSTVRMVARDEHSHVSSRHSSRSASSQNDQPSKASSSSGNASTSHRLLSLAVAKAAADTKPAVAKAAADTKSAAASEDSTSCKRHPQPVAEGSSSSHSSSTGGSSSSRERRRPRRTSSPEHRHRESSRSSKARSTADKPPSGEKSSTKTKFIVTLDGADKLKGSSAKPREVVDPPESEQPSTNVVQFIINDDLKRKHVEVEQVSDDVETEQSALTADPADIPLESLTEPAAKRPMERCRFWPNCTAGDACRFHHPSVPCRKMPACKFGAQCLYLHQDCKFDGRCTKLDCPYVHRLKPGQFNTAATPASGVPSSTTTPTAAAAVAGKPAPSSTICRFHPGCMRDYCPFLHPTACRYASNCTRSGCNFYHAPAASEPPQLPGRNAFRWTAKKDHVSDRKFAVEAAGESVIPADSAASSAAAQSTVVDA